MPSSTVTVTETAAFVCHAKVCGRVLRRVPGAVTVIRSSNATFQSCLERLAMSYWYIISDDVYLIFSAVLQTDLKWISVQSLPISDI